MTLNFFPSHSDFIFVVICYCGRETEIFIATLVIVLLKIIIKFNNYFSSYYKLVKCVRNKDSVTNIWNYAAKFCIVADYSLIGDILDRYCPGNAKSYKKIIGFKLSETKHIGMVFFVSLIKFVLEDIPQTIAQLFYVITKDENKRNCMPINCQEDCDCICPNLKFNISVRRLQKATN